MAVKYPTSISIVSPDWILESIDASMRLAEREYHPSVFRSSRAKDASQGRLVCNESREETTPSSAAPSNNNNNSRCNGDMSAEMVPVSSQPTLHTPSTAARVESHDEDGGAVRLVLSSSPAGSATVSNGPSAASEGNGGRDGGEQRKEGKVGGSGAVELAAGVGADPLGQAGTAGDGPASEVGGDHRRGKPDSLVVVDVELSGSVRKRSQSTVPTTPDASDPPAVIAVGDKMAGLSSSSSVALRSSGAVQPPAKSSSSAARLMECVTLCFSDYQECMDRDTLSKWKEVSVFVAALNVHTCMYVCKL